MEPIRPVDFSEIVGVEDPRLDPGGDRVAYVRAIPEDDESYERSIFMVDLDTGEERRLTVPAGSDGQPRWSPGGDRLAFVSDRLTEDDRPQLWVLPLDGGEARQVTSVCGGLGSIEWSPDGSRVLFTQQVSPEDIDAGRDLEVPEDYEAEEPDPRVVDRTIYRANERYFDRRREQVYLVDVDDGAVERVSTWDDTDHTAPVWVSDGTIRYLTKAGDDPDDSLVNRLVAVDLEDGSSVVVDEFEGFVVGMTASGRGHVGVSYFPSRRPTLRQAEVRVYGPNFEEPTVPTADLDRSVAGAPRFDPADDRLYVVTPDGGGHVVRGLPMAGGGDEVLTDPDAHVAAFDVGGGRLVVAQSEWDHPGDLFVGDLPGGDLERLTAVNADLLAERAVREPEERWFETEDGVEVQGWVLTPPEGAPTEAPYPLVLEIHGGPHAMWSTSGTMWHEFQSLAGAGYAVLWTNPRGSQGYGEAFASAIAEDWGDTTHTDVMAALEAVAERDDIDADQLFVTGGSFGGYQTAWTIGRDDRFEAAVAQRGVYDIPAFFGTTDAYRLIESEFDATPWDDNAFLYDRSPTSLVGSVDTPTLLIHSEDDHRTPIATAEMYFRALRKLGVPTRLVRYPREGHELSRSGEPGHRVDRIERIVRWFDGYADHADVPPALERPPDEGLTADEDDREDEAGGGAARANG